MGKIKLKRCWVLIVVGMVFAASWSAAFGETGDLQEQKEIILSKIDAGDIAAAKSMVDDLLVNFSGHPDIVEVINDIAGKYRSCCKYVEAAEMYKYIVTNHYDDSDAIGAQARMVKAYTSMGDEQAAYAAADDLLIKFAGNSQLGSRICEIADSFHRYYKFEKAKQLYQYATGIGLSVAGGYGIWAQKGVAMAAIRLGDEAGAESAIARLKVDFASNDRLARCINEIAKEYREVRNFDKACELYKYVQGYWPNDKEAIMAQVRLIKVYNEQGDAAAVGESFNKLLSAYQGFEKIDKAASEIGDYFSEHEQRGKALLAYKYIVDNCPGSGCMAAALGGVARLSAYLGDDAAAAAAIERLKAEFANDEGIVRSLCEAGLIYHGFGQKEKAGQLYSYILSSSGLPQYDDTVVWQRVAGAMLAMCQGDEAAGQAALDKLCVDFPRNGKAAEALRAVANMYGQNGDYQWAKVMWQMMLDKYPGMLVPQEELLFIIGACYYELDDYQQTIEYYTRVMEGGLAEDSFFRRQKASYYLGTLYQKLGNYSKATEWYGRHCQMYSGERSAEMAMLRWGKIYLSDVKDYASAAEIFVEYLAKYNDPDNYRIPEVLNMLALCYEKTGKAQQAAAISERLQEGYPDGAFVQSVVDEYE